MTNDCIDPIKENIMHKIGHFTGKLIIANNGTLASAATIA
jgi:hypothetical protein